MGCGPPQRPAKPGPVQRMLRLSRASTVGARPRAWRSTPAHVPSHPTLTCGRGSPGFMEAAMGRGAHSPRRQNAAGRQFGWVGGALQLREHWSGSGPAWRSEPDDRRMIRAARADRSVTTPSPGNAARPARRAGHMSRPFPKRAASSRDRTRSSWFGNARDLRPVRPADPITRVGTDRRSETGRLRRAADHGPPQTANGNAAARAPSRPCAAGHPGR